MKNCRYEGYVRLDPSGYRREIEPFKYDVLNLHNKLVTIISMVNNKDAIEKLNDADGKLSDIDEKVDDMIDAIREAEEEVNEILEASTYPSVSDLQYRENLLTSLSLQIDNAISQIILRCTPPQEEVHQEMIQEKKTDKENPEDPDPQCPSGETYIYGYVFNQDGEKLGSQPGETFILQFGREGYCAQWSETAPEACKTLQSIWGIPYRLWQLLWQWQPVTLFGVVVKIVLIPFFAFLGVFSALMGAGVCGRHCVNYVPGVWYDVPVNAEGAFGECITSSISYVVEIKDAGPYNAYFRDGQSIGTAYVGSLEERQINIVIPFPSISNTVGDMDGDTIVDAAEFLLAENHNPYWNFAGSEACESENLYPVKAPNFYSSRSYGVCKYRGEELPDKELECLSKDFIPYKELPSWNGTFYNVWGKYGIFKDGAGHLYDETENQIYYHVRGPSMNSPFDNYRIQYYLLFDYNDTDAAYNIGDHEGDWEWICVYIHAPHGIYYPTSSTGTYPFTPPGQIYKLHYHKHGIDPSDGETKWNTVRYYYWQWINGEYPWEYFIYSSKGRLPEVPAAWIGDSSHGIYKGPSGECYCTYRDVFGGCRAHEGVGYSGAPYRNPQTGNWEYLHQFTSMTNIDPSIILHDPTVRYFEGMWGDWGNENDPPKGPAVGTDNDRDYNIWDPDEQ